MGMQTARFAPESTIGRLLVIPLARLQVRQRLRLHRARAVYLLPPKLELLMPRDRRHME